MEAMDFIAETIMKNKRTTFRRFDVVKYFKYNGARALATDWLNCPHTVGLSPEEDRVSVYDIRVWLESKGVHVHAIDEVVADMMRHMYYKYTEEPEAVEPKMDNPFTLAELNLLSVTLYQARARQEELDKKYSPNRPGAISTEDLAALHEKVYAMLEARGEELDREVKQVRNDVEKEKKVTFMHGDEEITLMISIL